MKRIAVALILTAFIFCLSVSAENIIPKIGAAPPKLEMLSLDGQKISLEKYAGRKKIILTFFASWSKSCQEELKDLEKFQTTSKASLEVIAVSFDKKLNDLKNYASRANFSFPLVHDKKLSNIDTFQILIIPTTFCIGAEGKIDRIFIDYDGNVKEAIAQWLKS